MVFFALSSALLFGLALVLTQKGLRHAGPLQGTCIAITTAMIIFVVLAPFTVGFTAWSTGSSAIFAAIGLLFPATVTILTFHANRRIGPNLTGALGNLAPLFAVLLAIPVLGEVPGIQRFLAITVIVAGVILLFRAPSVAPQPHAAWAMWLPIAAAFIRGAIQPAAKLGLLAWPDPFAAVTIGYVVSSATVLAVAAVRARGWPVRYDRAGWLWFAAVGACNGLAVFCMYHALALGPVTLVAPLVACYPLATVVFGRAILGAASWNRTILVGVGVTVAGVILLLRG